MPAAQPDLFLQLDDTAERAPLAVETPPPEFVERIRAELEATLRMVRDALSLPWPDLTTATLAELRFNSIAGWLGEEDAKSMRADFDAELTRLYAAEDNRRAAGAR